MPPFDETDDLAGMFDALDHATAATYDSATTVNVIFDNAYAAELGVAGTNPVAFAQGADIPASGFAGKTLVIGATTYKIRSRQPLDDGAVVLLELERQ